MTTIPIESPGPTVTHYQQLATRFMAALDEVMTILPQLEAAQISTADFVRSHQNVPIRFLATAISAVEQDVELQRVGKLNVTAGRDTLQFLDAFRPVLDRGAAFIRKLRFMMNSKKAVLSNEALQIYDIAQGIARDPRSADVAAHVAYMKRDLGRPGPKKKAAAPAAPANPANSERKVA